MVTIISTVIILASILLLVFVVYVQNPKGGGLSTDFGAAQQLGGVQKTNDFIDKATWSLAGLVAVLSIFLTLQMQVSRNAQLKNQQNGTEANSTWSPGQGQGQTQGQGNSANHIWKRTTNRRSVSPRLDNLFEMSVCQCILTFFIPAKM